MSFYDWRDCPAEVKAQVDQLIAVFCEQIPAISGIYLHGSLAMGCFNPAHSDLDLLVITRQKMPLAAVAPLLQTFLNLSKRPIPIEISILNKNDLWPWDHPALYDLH